MSDHNTTLLAPNGCPLETHPEDPTHLFSANGLNLDLPRIGWIAAGVFTLISTIISLVLIYRHLQYYTKPNQQRYIVRMLLMVPIYAITSWFSFVYVREAVYYETIRVLYEAFVIASFLILMLQYLGESREDQKRALKRHKKTERWLFPMCCLKYNPSRPHFLQYMKWGILQYVPLNVVGTLLTVVLQAYGYYCESSWNPKFGHVWIMIVNFTSVTVATYFLIMFYLTIRVDLKDYSPFYKFMAVKLVVFFSFWQSVVIEGLVWFGIIKATTYWSTNDISVGINALLIDFEMVFFAFMHVKAFSYEPYIPKIRNPDLPPLEETLDEDDLDKEHKDDYNNNNKNNSGSMASIDSSLPSPGDGTGRTQPPKKSSKDDSKQTSKSKGKKDKKEEEGPPEMVLDRTQTTPLWKGLLDSFNPLDTLRELGYGFKYLRRLLDLERAFGRQRPEVPYVPPKESEKDKKKKKKKNKKKKKRGDDSEDDESTSGHEDDGGSEHESRKGDDDNDDDDDESPVPKRSDPDRPNRRREADLEKGYASVAESAYTDREHRGSGAQSKRRADVAYEMGYGYAPNMGASPRGTVRSVGVGVGVGGSRGVARKPVKPVVDTIDSSTAGRLDLKAKPKSRMKKESIEYLAKEDAARTERATLPDIQPDPVVRKIALSGLYVDMPVATIQPDRQMGSPASFSSLDIPVPMPYHQQHGVPFESHSPHPRNWERERDREYHIDMEVEPVRFEHRDRELERAAMAPEPYVLPAPVIPRSTRPELTATPVRVMETPDSHVSESIRTGGALTQHANKGFTIQDDATKKRETPSTEISHIVAKAVATAVATNAAATQGGVSAALANNDPKDPSTVLAEESRGKGKAKEVQTSQPQNHERNESAETISAQSSLVSGGQFYHHREGSRSDPELSHYGHDYEHYVRQMLLEEQEHQRRYYQQQLQGRAPPAESSASALEPEPAALTHQQVQQLQDQLCRQDEEAQQQPTPSVQYPDPRDELDPIVAQYSQIQRRQKEHELEQRKSEQHLERQPDAAAPAPEPATEQGLEPERPLPKQRLRSEEELPTSTMPKHPKPLLLPRRRNSLESLSSDSSGSFRFWGYASASRAAYDRDYYGYGGGYDAAYVRPKASRYHRAYRYPMPLPQPVPPAQFYRFPEDRDLYEQRRRQEDRLRQQQQQYYGSAAAANAAASSSSSSRVHPFLAQQRSSFYQGLQQVPRAYSSEYSQYAPHAHPSLEPVAYDYGGRYDPHRSPPSADPRYRSPPLMPLTGRSHYDQQRMMMAQQPSYGGAQPRIPSTYREERDRDRERDRMAPRDRREAPPGTELLFPASRYAAPFLRDYEIQQREGRRRMTQSPPPPPSSSLTQPTQPHESMKHGRPRKESHPPSGLSRVTDRGGEGGHEADDDGGGLGGAYRPPQPRAHYRQRPTAAPVPAAPSMPAYEDDDGPYEEAIVWARASMPPAAAPTSSTGATDGS
ncbi:hypothetical protein BGZ70_000752 [Mortierella alpina]|uniref:DUF300-domain-containing protein n=1 Tax=Mortierella alpina TaxID=64518 RepID=A0A9P6IZ33_MORAP|nr:hypothetical protein BGZ70_000752 [Mortierella alpina]